MSSITKTWMEKYRNYHIFWLLGIGYRAERDSTILDTMPTITGTAPTQEECRARIDAVYAALPGPTPPPSDNIDWEEHDAPPMGSFLEPLSINWSTFIFWNHCDGSVSNIDPGRDCCAGVSITGGATYISWDNYDEQWRDYDFGHGGNGDMAVIPWEEQKEIILTVITDLMPAII